MHMRERPTHSTPPGRITDRRRPILSCSHAPPRAIPRASVSQHAKTTIPSRPPIRQRKKGVRNPAPYRNYPAFTPQALLTSAASPHAAAAARSQTSCNEALPPPAPAPPPLAMASTACSPAAAAAAPAAAPAAGTAAARLRCCTWPPPPPAAPTSVSARLRTRRTNSLKRAQLPGSNMESHRRLNTRDWT